MGSRSKNTCKLGSRSAAASSGPPSNTSGLSNSRKEEHRISISSWISSRVGSIKTSSPRLGFRITGGTEKQFSVHNHPFQWIKWKMTNSSYLMKNYIVKKDQKEIPEHYLNVGRFWGASRNLTPVPTIIEPRSIAKASCDWTEQQLYRFMNRTLRRFHEKSINYDRKTWIKRKGKRKLSPLVRGHGEHNGFYRIPFGAKVVYQVINYCTFPPDEWAVMRGISEKLPF